MRTAAAARRDEVIAAGKGGTHQAREERDVIVRSSLARLEQLKLGDEALSFGRIDRGTGERFYIGRLGVSDHDHEPLIVDWRAPVAEPFYRATGRHPMGLTRRRHFITDGRRIRGIEDEVLDLDAFDAVGSDDSSLAGEGALFAALERSRSGSMRDIVATIQGEQDEIIRAPLPVTLVVQGGPGTGKTAVALHRAAYLLYTHRFPLERQGVLVVGPNPLFLRYIQNVLPSLGETGVTLSTISGLYRGIRPKRDEEPRVARIKGDPRMAAVISRAVKDRQRPLRADAVVPYGAYQLRLTVAASREIVAAGRRRRGPHNDRRAFVESLVFRHLHDELGRTYERAARAGLLGSAEKDVPLEDLVAAVRGTPAVRELLDRMWPRLSPEELLHDLFGAEPLLQLAAERHLRRSEWELLRRDRAESPGDVEWTHSDAPLLDEASVLLGPRRRRRNQEVEVNGFGHVVVDETQDLTPMQLRMVGRRSLSGSMTLVGDVGQATGPFGIESWDDVLAHLPHTRAPHLVELTVNYRTPAEIMEVAAAVLAEAAPGLHPPESVRSSGHYPAVRRVPEAALVSEAVAEGEALQQAIGGIVAVIVPPSLAGPAEALAGNVESDALDRPVSAVPVSVVKGLEFDGVIVVEPALIAGESSQGLRALYVALTRATKRLVVVHSRPLPAALRLDSVPQVEQVS